MQITLNEDEIKDAVQAYVRGQISIAANQDIEIDLKAGRGDNGFSATLDIRAKAMELGKTVTRTSGEAGPAKTRGITATPEAREEGPVEAVVEPAVEKPVAAAAPKKAGGLFGNKPSPVKAEPEAAPEAPAEEPETEAQDSANIAETQEPDQPAEAAPAAEEAAPSKPSIFNFAPKASA